jgi:acetylornithine deacetylase/succinyl-diaminopimelate desuccinylase-like protein
VLGPGSITHAHTAREFVEVEQVELATRFFVALLSR